MSIIERLKKFHYKSKVETARFTAANEIGMEHTLRGLFERGYKPKVVYDIGAAVGGWTKAALEIWPKANFVCFEPLHERFGELSNLKKLHPRKIRIEKCGIGDHDGELELGVTDFLWDSSFAYSGSSSRIVPIYKLDTFVSQGLPKADFLKIDVQGFEKRVLEGGKNAISSAAFILLECNFFEFCEDMSTLDVTIAFMSQRGFIPYEIVDVLRRPYDGAMGQCDILFIRREHSLVAVTKWR